MKKLIPLLCAAACLINACDDDEKKREAEIQAKVEKVRTVLANQCSKDDDCMITGCHNSMCRAMPEPEYCDQRIVVAVENEADIAAVKRIVTEQLTVSEADSLRIGGYAAGKWTISFNAPQSQRKRESALEHLPQSGFARLHPAAQKYTNALYGELQHLGSDVSLKSMKGVGNLVEKQIRSGDILSKDDIRNTWEQIEPSLAVKVSEDDEIERLWAYDVIIQKIAYLRLWPIDKRQRITARLWKDFDMRVDNGDIIISATLEQPFADTLRRWTENGSIIVVLLGTEVVASAIPNTAITDGSFELVINDGAKSDITKQNIQTLKAVTQLKGSVHLDRPATAKVERDLTCLEQFPRECACIDGSCGWKQNVDYNKCLYE